MNDVIRLNANIPISSLYKIVIDMLKETLSSSIKLADYVNSESSWLNDAKLTELKKNCVQYFLKNVNNEKNLQTLRDKVQIAKLELFNVLSDCLSEPDAMKHINHLSDEPINIMFIKCQNYCITKIELFIEQENSEKLAHFADLPSQSLTNELLGLKQLELLKVLNNVWFSELNECNSLPDSSMNICIEQCYYLIYLANLHETLVNQFQPVFHKIWFSYRQKTANKRRPKRIVEQVEKNHS
ncbi:uncharacterized protein LOC135839591 isoform X1 [Planococcus citri]|uniref:uncharacterized protein LOC135839591 isoform X1 n=1 Tax=Planococcus citri TaxID=170843 RepID=UPI0031F8C462